MTGRRLQLDKRSWEIDPKTGRLVKKIVVRSASDAVRMKKSKKPRLVSAAKAKLSALLNGK